MKQANKQANLAELFQPQIEPFEVVSAPINSFYRVTIDEPFREVRQFSQLVDILDNAQEGDLVSIKLSTDGGALHSIVPLINSMNNTDAHIHVHVESDCASAGTIVMMLADSVYVNPYANIMLHTCQYGYGGHAGNMDAHVTYATKAIEKLIRETYKDWLNDEEIDRLLDGKEFWFDAEECMTRFELREELRQQECMKSTEEVSEEDLESAMQMMEAALTPSPKTNKQPKK